MSTIFSLIIKNHKNLLTFFLIPFMTVAAGTSMLAPYLISNNNNDDNDNLFNNFNNRNNNRAFAQQSTNAPSTNTLPPLSPLPIPPLSIQVPTNKITITLSSAQFYPLTDPTFNQLKMIVRYKTNDLSLLNTTTNGIMQVSL